MRRRTRPAILRGLLLPASRRAILLFVTYPEPGKVKTDLAATVGPEAAAQIYRRLVAGVCRSLPADAVLFVQFDPPEKRREVEAWFREMGEERPVLFEPLAAGDPGRRLTHAFDIAFQGGFSHVAAIGSDRGELTPEIFASAWSELEGGADVVLGPGGDGGYYLIGLKKRCERLFEDVAWSAGAVLAQTQERATEAGLRAALLPPLHDVDTEHDWQRAQVRMNC